MAVVLKLYLVTSLLWIACAPMKQHDSSRVDDLAAKLASCKVADMANGLSMDRQVTAVWNEFGDVGLYMPLLEDAHRPAAVRFAAALVLRSKHAEQLRKANPRVVAQVFATALQLDLAGLAEPWGRLWASGDPLGLLGQIFIELGRPAQQPLEALLDDTTVRDSYTGSEEATEMAMRRYRVKDFAAFYLAKILGLELPWEANLARRDEAIARLRTQLPHE
jgi:hypothetical protein